MATYYLGELSHLTPTVNFAQHMSGESQTYWGPRIIPDCQLFYVASGKASLSMSNGQFTIGPGQCAFYGVKSPHTLLLLQPTSYYSIHFHWHHPSPEPVHPAFGLEEWQSDVPADQASLAKLAGLAGSAEPADYAVDIQGYGRLQLPRVSMVPGLEPIMYRIVEEYQREGLLYRFMLRSLAMELLSTWISGLVSQPDASADSPASRVYPALAAMRNQPQANWSVGKLAAMCGYHPNHFTKVFKAAAGQAPKDYLIAQRIRQAKMMLLAGEKIEDIAARAGYSSTHYFSRNFKAETGLTPTEFRQQGKPVEE